MISRPRVYARNEKGILLQIIRNAREDDIFMKLDEERRCIITDLVNFNAWEKGDAPYNQKNISFGIRMNYYEAFTGGTN